MRILLAVILVLGLLGAVLAALLRPPELPTPGARTFVLPDVAIVDPALDRRTGDLRVADGWIQVAGTSDAPILSEYRGMTVLPGLVDMHTHLPPPTPLGLTEYFGLLYLAHGVTTVREAGDLDGAAVQAAEEARAAGAPMPRVRSCGPFVGGAARRWENWIHLERPDEAADVAARLRDEGRICVKVYDGLDAPRVHALVEAAEAEGLAPIGHVPFGMRFEEALISDTQHLMGVTPPEDIAAGDHVVHRILDWRAVDDARLEEVVRASVEHDLAHTPTLGLTEQVLHYEDYESAVTDPSLRRMPGMYRKVVWHPAEGIPLYRGLGPADFDMIRAALPKKLSLVRRLHEAGVRLRLGTDTQQPFVVPGASVWHEMRLFVRAGIPPEEVWAYGTWRSSDGLGSPAAGRLGDGAAADLLVFRQDPTRSLSALDTLEAVVVGGRLYSRAALLQALEEWRAYYESWLIDTVSRVVARQRMEASIKGDR